MATAIDDNTADENLDKSKVRLISLSHTSSPDTYTYNLKSKRLSKNESGCSLTLYRKGAYVIGDNFAGSGYGPYKKSIYRFTKSGVKKIKVLLKYCCNAIIKGNTIYYDDYGSYSFGHVSIYKCNLNGSGKKKLASFKTNLGWLYIESISSKSCRYSTANMLFEYNYKEKKSTKNWLYSCVV